MYSSIYPRKPRARRNHRRVEPAANPPPVTHQILFVHYDGDPTAFDAQVSAELLSVAESPSLIELSIDGSEWVGVQFAALDDEDHSHVFLQFDQDLSEATLWRVTTPGDWVFVDGGVLGAPLSGSIG